GGMRYLDPRCRDGLRRGPLEHHRHVVAVSSINPTLELVHQRDHRSAAVLPPTIRTSSDHVHAVDDPAHTSPYDERVAHNEKDRPGPGMRLGGSCDLGTGRS